MKTAIGSDHAGFELKKMLAKFLRDLGDDVIDVGTNNTDPVDYPDFAEAVGKAVLDGRADRGVLICGSGIGASVAITSASGKQWNVVRSGSSYASQSDLALVFGLGQDRVVTSIEVTWPSGTTQKFANVSANQFITIDETRGILK